MIIDLKTIPGEGKKYFSYTLDRGWWSPGEEDYQIEAIETPISVELTIYRVESKYVLDGVFKGALRVVCDRCLEPYRLEIEAEFNYFLVPVNNGAGNDELELMEEDIEVVFIRDDKVNLNEVIREQLFLSLPVKCLCRIDCLGLCAKCGCNLNVSSCECITAQGHPAFATLNKLKN
ncbi:MAG: DUF177 domain-containing protein [Desulfatiglans sp.]|jgi:uncharacterized protein|nr:DUF177 domain-containing protein [Desulfatiglans sp.]